MVKDDPSYSKHGQPWLTMVNHGWQMLITMVNHAKFTAININVTNHGQPWLTKLSQTMVNHGQP